MTIFEKAVKIRTQFSKDMIEQWDEWGKDSLMPLDLIQEHTKRIINLRDQGVRDALKKLGWLSPEEAEELTLKSERYDWIATNIEEEVYQLPSEYVGVKTKYVLPKMTAYAEFTGQISFDVAVDIARGLHYDE